MSQPESTDLENELTGDTGDEPDPDKDADNAAD
jgi:hypothetical protein